MNRSSVVFVVDDERDNAELVLRTLASYDVRIYTDPQKALKDALEEPPDGLVVDYRMPGLNGVQLVKALREEKVDSTVLMVTAFPELDEVVFAQQSNLIYRIIPKPFEPAYLDTQMQIALAENRLLARDSLRDIVMESWESLLGARKVTPDAAAALGLNLRPATGANASGGSETVCRVDISGYWKGSLIIGCDVGSAARIAALLSSGNEASNPEDVVRQGFGEFVTAVAERLGGMVLPTYSLSAPTMVSSPIPSEQAHSIGEAEFSIGTGRMWAKLTKRKLTLPGL